MRKMQDKLQRVVRRNENEAVARWTPFEGQRHTHVVPDTQETVAYSAAEKQTDAPGGMAMSHNNELPPGYHIDEQQGHNGRFTPVQLAGVGDVQGHLTDRTLREGYFVAAMDPAEDMYSGEHQVGFYGDAGGFVERNNMLDRL